MSGVTRSSPPSLWLKGFFGVTVARGSLLISSGVFQTSNAVLVKSRIKQLKVFQKDDTKSASSHDIYSWKKAIGEKLRYSATELRKNLEKTDGVGDTMCDFR